MDGNDHARASWGRTWYPGSPALSREPTRRDPERDLELDRPFAYDGAGKIIIFRSNRQLHDFKPGFPCLKPAFLDEQPVRWLS
ncbi:hypothetical protein D779_0397 [Imhoffiella purpurea]|uniref:Uncharacterized protein n=1 Tax=Imhoffiella purpurea TaxID=1249627 RepID=W9W0X8_9GAMM|nr:hypothetical protein D779_0397 [Imhoffiella purpurea]